MRWETSTPLVRGVEPNPNPKPNPNREPHQVGNLNAALDALTEQNGQLQRDYAELAQRHRKQGAELSTASASLQVRARAMPTWARPTFGPT